MIGAAIAVRNQHLKRRENHKKRDLQRYESPRYIRNVESQRGTFCSIENHVLALMARPRESKTNECLCADSWLTRAVDSGATVKDARPEDYQSFLDRVSATTIQRSPAQLDLCSGCIVSLRFSK